MLSVDVDQIELEKDNLKLNKEAARNPSKRRRLIGGNVDVSDETVNSDVFFFDW